VTDTGGDLFARVAALPGVEPAAAAARRAVDGLLAHRLLRRRSGEVTAEIALRDAWASASLEGLTLSLDELRARLETGDVVPEVAQGALRVSAALGELAPVWETAPRQALARLHVLAATRGDGQDAEALGRPRESAEVTARLDLLADTLTAPTRAPAVVVAALVHGELLALAPFGSRDGVVARASARLLLVSRAVDPLAVTAPDLGHLDGGYAAAARAYATGDVARWVLHCCAALERGAEEGLAVCRQLSTVS
jgi:hypothetical protein